MIDEEAHPNLYELYRGSLQYMKQSNDVVLIPATSWNHVTEPLNRKGNQKLLDSLSILKPTVMPLIKLCGKE